MKTQPAKKCPICKCGTKIIKTVFGYGIECEKNGHLHNIGSFETEEKAIAAWNSWSEMLKLGYVALVGANQRKAGE